MTRKIDFSTVEVVSWQFLQPIWEAAFSAAAEGKMNQRNKTNAAVMHFPVTTPQKRTEMNQKVTAKRPSGCTLHDS